MPLPQRWHKNKKNNKGQPPEGFERVEATLEALEHELRDKIKETNEKKRKTESMWPVHQINWQKSRYIYDMYYTVGNDRNQNHDRNHDRNDRNQNHDRNQNQNHGKISREVYLYCLQQKLVDAALIAKWKKPGYERLCSTYVINPTNYKFGTTSICRVPFKDRNPEQKSAQDPTTGCLGCASGKHAGPRNIFGNKYGQYLAAVQVAREDRETIAKAKANEQEQEQAAKNDIDEEETDDDDDDDDDEDDFNNNDDDDEEDYGPTPAAGIWAGSQKLQEMTSQNSDPGDTNDNHNKNDNDNDDGGDEETEDEDEDEDEDDEEGPALPPPAKKIRQE